MFKDSSNSITTSWGETSVTEANTGYSQAVIGDLQADLDRMREERDRWKEIARQTASIASRSPQTFYGRTVEYILAHAEKNA